MSAISGIHGDEREEDVFPESRVHSEPPAEGDLEFDEAEIRAHSMDPAEGANEDRTTLAATPTKRSTILMVSPRLRRWYRSPSATSESFTVAGFKISGVSEPPVWPRYAARTAAVERCRPHPSPRFTHGPTSRARATTAVGQSARSSA